MDWLVRRSNGGYARWRPSGLNGPAGTFSGGGYESVNSDYNGGGARPKMGKFARGVVLAGVGVVACVLALNASSDTRSSNFDVAGVESVGTSGRLATSEKTSALSGLPAQDDSAETSPIEAPADAKTSASLASDQAWPVDPVGDSGSEEDAYAGDFDELDFKGSNDEGTGLCAGWCPDSYLDKIACERKGLSRLKTAFQIENCEAALKPKQRKDVASKIEKLSESTVFVFFRGAAAFFDYNMMCADENFTRKKNRMPRVYSNGDCHPENFGVMVQASNNVENKSNTGDLVWGVNDFDQSFLTPFSWDLKRGAVGFALGIHDRGWAVGDVASIAWGFIESYVDTIMARKDCRYLDDERFVEGSSYTRKKTPVIQALFDKARKMDTPEATLEWLEDKMAVDVKKRKFLVNKKRGIHPLDDKVIPVFQASIDAWLFHGVAALAKYPNTGDFYKVLSVARKDGSGTGSIGLQRYWVLINGRFKEPHGQIILEMKQSVNSVLEAFFRYTYTKSQEGKRAIDAMRSAWPYTELFYGWTTHGEDSFIVRERSKHHKSANIEKLSKDEYLEYARASGRALAFYHVRERCPNYECKLKAHSAVDSEICTNIQEYLEGFGVWEFKRYIYSFARTEFVRQVNAFELLNRFVNHRKALKPTNSTFDPNLDILVGPKPVGESCKKQSKDFFLNAGNASRGTGVETVPPSGP